MTALGQYERADLAATQPVAPRHRIRYYQGLILVVALAYLVQAATPLRLHPDSVVLLSMADSFAHGGGLLYEGQPTVFPPGYPAFVALLLKLGLAHNWLLIAFNLASLAIGLWATGYILFRRFFETIYPVLNVCLVSLFSFVFIKYSTIPLTEAGFFGLAMCSLAVMESASQLSLERKFWLRILASWCLILAALTVRRVGLALVPALLWSIFSHSEVRSYMRRLSGLTKIGILLGMAGASGITAWVVKETSTLRDRQSVVSGLPDVISRTLIGRFRELSEIGLNVPFSALPPALRLPALLAGGLLLALVLGGVIMSLRGFWRGSWREVHVTAIFFTTYCLIIFCWPYYDPRFWLPVIPLLAAYAGLSVKHAIARHRFWEGCLRVYLAIFVLIGTMTLGWSTAITFSGKQFPDTYQRPKARTTADLPATERMKLQIMPDGYYLWGEERSFRGTYCAIFQSCSESPAPVDESALHVYRTFQ
jgi:hypothetical protein